MMALSGQADVLSFLEKAEIFSRDYLKCCIYITDIVPELPTYTKLLYANLVSTSQLLEDFLDFHGAKNNSSWYFYRELAAMMRHLSGAAYSQRHIFNRLPFYELGTLRDFNTEGENTHKFLTSAIQRLAPVVLEEAYKLGILCPENTFCVNDFPKIPTPQILDFDIDDQEVTQERKHVVNIASSFLDISKSFDELGLYESMSKEAIRDIVPAKVNEVKLRHYELVVHNLQSAFDTYVICGGYRFENRDLKRFRGYFSVILHLLELSGRLLHFYERHLFETGYKNVYKRVRDHLALLVDPDALLDRAINYALYYVCQFSEQGRKLAHVILNENIERNAIQVGIPVELGFHVRPSILVAKIVEHYGGQVELVIGEYRFDAGSALDIQWAGGKIDKEEISDVIFEGDIRALNDIAILASVNYGEDSMGRGVPLPMELAYLR